jgi:phage shock protein B
MEDVFLPIVICAMLFIGLPWVVLHYLTQWRKSSSITAEDENLLDDLYESARRMEERLATVERIIAADNPNWKSGI